MVAIERTTVARLPDPDGGNARRARIGASAIVDRPLHDAFTIRKHQARRISVVKRTAAIGETKQDSRKP
jgi:hypothetical protein